MAPHRGHGPRRQTKPQHTRNRQLKRKRDVEDIEALDQSVRDFDPASTPDSFDQFPLSKATKAGLAQSHFKTPTEIQTKSIFSALKGKDVVASAVTGSGKTLSFLIPVLECLFRKRYTTHDGVGALIISPTRELCIQIFDVLRGIGRHHTFSACLLIGGKSYDEERSRMHGMNLVVATPGRILQHLDQNAEFTVDHLSMLVLDEVDRLVDMGFQGEVTNILDHLPKERQTLLFTATLPKASELARLHLSDPELISIHNDSTATPSLLQQSYIIVPLPSKLDVLWSFLRNNLKKKTLVFLSTCKMVKFVYSSFAHLQPGLTLLSLHGKQSLSARLDVNARFRDAKAACIFCTDLASRGLDFPSIDFVIQADCPDSIESYIHRVGRTARYNSKGRGVLFLDPSEAPGMLDALNKKNVGDVEEIHVRQKKMQLSVRSQLQNMCLKDPTHKYLAQRAFVTILRGIHIQKDKNIFDLKNYDLVGFAQSMGLAGAPRVRFVRGDDVKKTMNTPRALAVEPDSSEDSEDGDRSESKPTTKTGKPVRTKYDRLWARQNRTLLSTHYAEMIHHDEGSSSGGADDDDDLMIVKSRYNNPSKQSAVDGKSLPSPMSDLGSDAESAKEQFRHHGQLNGTNTAAKDTASREPAVNNKEVYLSTNPAEPPLLVDSNRRAKLLKGRKNLLKYKKQGQHMVFGEDEDDNVGTEKIHYEDEAAFKAKGAASMQRDRFLQEEREKAEAEDVVDREALRTRRREKKIRRKEWERRMAAGGDERRDGDDEGVQLLPYQDDVNIGFDNGFEDGVNSREDDVTSESIEKRKRRWSEDTESREQVTTLKKRTKKDKRRPRIEDTSEQPQTLEDLENMAAGLLAR